MKLILIALTAILTLTISQVFSQTNAITEKGDTVVLLDNGRWEFIENYRLSLLEPEAVIETNPIAFSVPVTSRRVTKNFDGNYESWYNEKTWQEIDPKSINPIAEKAFASNDNEAYGMIIYEPLKITLESLQEIAVSNAKRTGENVKVIKSEYRTVNDQKILSMEMSAEVMGLSLNYIYYFANKEEGCLQFITFSAHNDVKKMKPMLFDLLNGLVMKEKK